MENKPDVKTTSLFMLTVLSQYTYKNYISSVSLGCKKK